MPVWAGARTDRRLRGPSGTVQRVDDRAAVDAAGDLLTDDLAPVVLELGGGLGVAILGSVAASAYGADLGVTGAAGDAAREGLRPPSMWQRARAAKPEPSSCSQRRRHS